ncbi:MAG: DUF6055 domain-containing protein [Balneolaceae bacterium]
MDYPILRRITPVLFLILAAGVFTPVQTVFAQSGEDTTIKELRLPEDINRVPSDNDFNDPESEFSYDRMALSKSIGVFWHKDFGSNPAEGPDGDPVFDLGNLLMELERYYEYFVDELKFIDPENTDAAENRALLFVISGSGGTAFGGGSDGVGMMWSPTSRIQSPPYGVLAHELGHSFQYLVRQNGGGFRGGTAGRSIGEMTSQYKLWHVYPEWMTFENYHLVDYLEKTHFAFLHRTNQYHSPYVLEYWATLHGKDIIGKLWRNAEPGEDPVLAYQRLTEIDQPTFNDQMFDAARRFMTWDMDRVEEVASPYANMHTSEFDAIGDGWYQIAESRTPQNYGYNGVQLEVPASGTNVTVDFRGIAGADGFQAVNVDLAGWRYGFVAVQSDGSRVYGDTHSNPEGEASINVPEGTEYLWFVVSGAPAEHWVHGSEEEEEQWPYQIRLDGTGLHDSVTVNN